MGIEEVLIAHRSPWQNPFVERLIGSIRRECLDHVIVLGEKHLRRILGEYFRYYHLTALMVTPDELWPPCGATNSPASTRRTEFWQRTPPRGPARIRIDGRTALVSPTIR